MQGRDMEAMASLKRLRLGMIDGPSEADNEEDEGEEGLLVKVGYAISRLLHPSFLLIHSFISLDRSSFWR